LVKASISALRHGEIEKSGLHDVFATHGLLADIRFDKIHDDVPIRRTFTSNERHMNVSAADLSDR
jgi:hypothetical protein